MGMTAMFAGAALSASSSRKAGKQQQQLNEYNAQVGELQAVDAIARGAEEEGIHRKRVKGMIGSQRAAWGASGADVNSGNAVDVQADTAKFGELDALTIRTNAAREAWGYRVGAQDQRMRGTIARQEGNAKAVGTIASAAGNYFTTSYGFGSTRKA